MFQKVGTVKIIVAKTLSEGAIGDVNEIVMRKYMWEK